MLLCACIQTPGSLRLLSVPSSGRQIMWYFLSVQSWHRLDLLSYALALRMIAHLMLCGLSCSFNFQTCLLSSVLLRLFECRKVVLWPLNRSLKVFLVRPMYVSFEPSSSVVTVAWYMTDFISLNRAPMYTLHFNYRQVPNHYCPSNNTYLHNITLHHISAE